MLDGWPKRKTAELAKFDAPARLPERHRGLVGVATCIVVRTLLYAGA